jgi:3-oxoacyl-[acyl-carrier-protein] synthase II
LTYITQNYPLVIVDIASIDAGTEQLTAIKTKNNTWIRKLPYSFSDLTEMILDKTTVNIRNHVIAAIVCSLGKDTHARNLAASDAKCSPRIALNALGGYITYSLSNYFPKINNIFNIDAACASGIAALDLAVGYKDINAGVILVMGVEVPTSDQFLNYFRHLKAVVERTDTPFTPFDIRRAGFVMADGAAFIAVTTKQYAIKHNLNIIAVVDSVGSKTIVTHPTAPSEFTELKNFVESVISNSGKRIQDISWWDAHATSTPAGDDAEYNLFSEIFQNTNTVISSYKGIAGHCMGASSLVELVNAIKCTQAGYASKTYMLSEEFKLADDDRLITDDHKLSSNTFIKTSFGFGGRNGAAVISVLPNAI